MHSFQDKNIWIIGASSGIGRALAVELSAQGARLIISARRKEILDELNEELGGQHHVFTLDIADHNAVIETANTVRETVGRIDSIVFMAALYSPMDIDNMDMQMVKNIIDVNLTGALNVVHGVLPILKQQGNSQLALCASVSGYTGLPAAQPYGATKAGLLNFAESLRAELGDVIDIKVINPGFVETPLTEKNDFSMPMIITPQKAAQHIAKGLLSKGFEIHFPKGFTIWLKLLRLLPYWLYFWCARKIKA